MVITIKINKEREGEIILTQMIHKMNISLWGWLGGGVEGLALVCQSSSCGKLTKFTKTDPPGCLASQGCVFCFLLVSETCQYLVIPLITQPILEENAKNSYFKPNYTERSFWTFLKVEDLDALYLVGFKEIIASMIAYWIHPFLSKSQFRRKLKFNKKLLTMRQVRNGQQS